jgi:hypothetical protein
MDSSMCHLPVLDRYSWGRLSRWPPLGEKIMFRTALVLGVSIVLMFVVGCGDPPLGPVDDDFLLPEPDLSLDPARLVVGDYIATPCAFGMFGNQLVHLRDRNEWALVDIFFGSGTRAGPSEAEVEEVRRRGGRVLHRFNVPAVRARILLSSIPDLVREGHWITVREVPDPSRYDLELSVGYRRPTKDLDLAIIAAYGGRVTARYVSIPWLSVILPDRAVPVLRDRYEVQYVESAGVACIG